MLKRLIGRFLGATVVACFTAACSGNSSSPVPRTAPYEQHAPLRGGNFTAAYAGTYIDFGNRQSLKGSGKATFFGDSSELGTVDVWCGPNCYNNGTFTFTSTRHSANSITVGWSNHYGRSVCNVGFDWHVYSGTGKFAQVSGSGSVTFKCSGNSYTDNWSGVLAF